MSAEPVPLLLVARALITAIAIAVVIRTARERRLDQRSRRAWNWVAVSLGLDIMSGLAALVLDAAGVLPSYTQPIATALTLASQGIMLAAFLCKPSAPATATERAILGLDAAIVAIGGTLAVWYALHTSSADLPPLLLFGLSRSQLLVDALLLMLLFAMWQRTALVSTARALLVVAVAIGLFSVQHVASTLTSDVSARAMSWANAAHVVGVLLIALGAWIRNASAHAPLVRSPAQMVRARSLGRLDPFLALAPGAVLLLKVVYDAELAPFAGLVGGAVVLVFFVLLRQHASVQQTVRARGESSEEQHEMRFNALVQHSSDVTTILDAHGGIRYASPAVANVLGLEPRRLVGRRIASLLHPDDVERASQFLANLRPAGDPRLTSDGETLMQCAEWRIMNGKGEWMTVENVATNLLVDPVVQGIVLNSRDVTEQRLIRDQFAHRASHDQLTEMANRASFVHSLEQALARSQRSLEPLAILILDIDGFRTVNESLGHGAGDALLREVSRRLKACVRDGEAMARLNGDEFAILIEQQASADTAVLVAGRIATAISQPFQLDGTVAVVSASIGMALSTLGDGADDLMRNADVAMHVAKSRGHGHCVQYAAGMQTIASERLLLEADLREAVEREAFVLEYQPIVMLHTGEIIGAEALVRWACEKRGVVSPSVFIPVAEETGLIVPIGRWVLHHACTTAQQWTRVYGTPMRITVNLSGRQLLDAGLVEDVRRALSVSELPAAQLTLELTESALMADTSLSLERLTALKTLGVSLAIDDFGTGYSSLAYLQRYPIDILKIDKSFVDVLDQDEIGPVLAGVIVALGNTLQMHTVAEGIETALQRERILNLGCELGQGYLFSRPLAAGAFEALLADRGTATYSFTQRHHELSARAA